MGTKHVIPQFILRLNELLKSNDSITNIEFPIQGSGKETRAFCYVDDIVDGILIMLKKGLHREIYHIGNDSEISINELAKEIARLIEIKIRILPTQELAGGTKRRCPNITKIRKLGYQPKVDLIEGLRYTINWYKNFKNSCLY